MEGSGAEVLITRAYRYRLGMNEGPAREQGAGVDASLQFRSLVQQSSDMVSIYDDHGRYVFANPAHRDVLGFEPEELIGHLPLDFVHPDEAESVAIEFAAQLAGERPAAPLSQEPVAEYRARASSQSAQAVVADRRAPGLLSRPSRAAVPTVAEPQAP